MLDATKIEEAAVAYRKATDRLNAVRSALSFSQTYTGGISVMLKALDGIRGQADIEAFMEQWLHEHRDAIADEITATLERKQNEAKAALLALTKESPE